MNRILSILGIILLIIVGVALFLGFQNSGAYTVSRSRDLSASPEQIYKVAANYNKWNDWSPWAGLDPKQTITVTGEPLSVGHHFEWKGNEQVGSGNMTITALKPNESIEEDLEFTAPQQSKCKTYLKMKANGNKTSVTWSLSGESGFVEGIFMGLMGGMDKMLGSDFDKGLEKLEAAAAKEVVTPAI